jgi:NTE family protein
MSLDQTELATMTIEQRNAAWLARAFPLFKDLEPHLLEALAAEIDWFAIQGGTTLFQSGDEPDALYCVFSGSLGAYASSEEGHRRLVGRIQAGETVGEMALISGKPRNATVIALRDTELGRLSRAVFERLMLSHSPSLLRLSQLLVQRLEVLHRQPRGRRSIPKTFTVVPHEVDEAAVGFATGLAECLGRIDRAALITSQEGSDRTSHWFHGLERANEFIVYLCDATPTSWTKMCLRQADSVLLLCHGERPATTWHALDGQQDRSMLAQRTDLVVLQEQRIAPGCTLRWLDLKPGLAHHQIRGPADVARLARLLTGNGLGVVLSGGGARGFAHLGVLRALREAGVVIDAVGGTSIGALIGAGFASEWTDEELRMRMQRSFVDTNPVNDYTLPLVSLVSGRKVTRLLRREFAEHLIEDLPIPFFCVSTNLSSGQLVVHRRGPLWRWLRASVAIPGVLPPVVERGELYVDGATINNLPVDVMRDAGLGCVIGVDVGADPVFTTDSVDSDAPPFWKLLHWFGARKRRINILEILWRSGMVNSAANTLARRELSDLLLQPPLEQIDMLDWRAFDRAIEAGYGYASARVRDWIDSRRHADAPVGPA